MASERKGEGESSNGSVDALSKAQASVVQTASQVAREVEKRASSLTDNVKGLFETATERTTSVATNAAKTITSVADKVASTSTEVTRFVGSMVDDARQAGETSLRVLGCGLDAVRDNVSSVFGLGRKAERAAEPDSRPAATDEASRAGEKSAPQAQLREERETAARNAGETEDSLVSSADQDAAAMKPTEKEIVDKPEEVSVEKAKLARKPSPAPEPAPEETSVESPKVSASPSTDQDAVAKKTAARKPAVTKKVTAKKTTKKATARKVTAKKATARKTATKKATTKKPTVRKKPATE